MIYLATTRLLLTEFAVSVAVDVRLYFCGEFAVPLLHTLLLLLISEREVTYLCGKEEANKDEKWA